VKLSVADWRAASGLLDEALELPCAARLAWVDTLSGDQSALKPVLRELLARQGQLETGDFLGVAPSISALLPAREADPIPSLLAGTTVGVYRLVRELGRGGMGTVWLAERADALIRRPVALKLPHPALYDGHFAERFARERDILAALNHRSIARLYDAGISAVGQPFLALEYVEGIPLTEYCDQRAMPLDARIGLFREVLHAVEYAHELRVIHRDLKPSNILITTSGEVRLLDFGIAKLIPAGGGEETQLTRLGGRAFTMDYAAPEQLARQPVSAESDVYSLGVILYELLTGSRPYRPKRQSLGALEESILNEEPARPSARDIPEATARSRAVSSARLRSQLRGDLDTIVLKALRKRASERYASAQAFALDLQRHLHGQPVQARADTTLYRLGKFAARNKFMVGAASLAVGALVVGAVLSLWQARLARAQAAEALQEAKRAQVVQNFLLDIFRANSHLQSDPLKARQTTARELLDAGAQRVGEDLKDVPAAEEQVLGTLSDMYEQLGLEQEAAALQLQRVDAIKRAYGGADPRVASALSRYAKALANTPDRGRIEAVLGEAKKILDEAHDDSSIVRADVLVDYASFYRYSSPQDSRRYADEDVALLQKHHPDDDTLLLALQSAARARAALGQYPTAVEWYQRDLAAIASQVGQGTAWDIAPLAQLAGAQAQLLRFSEAERDFRASLALSERLNGEVHNETLQTQIRLAAFLEATSRHPEGRKLMERAWSVFNDDPGKKDNSVASVMYGLYGQSLMDAGELQAAQPLIAAEVEKVRGLYPESTLLSQALLRQASLRIELGQYDVAEAELQSALAGWRHVGGPEAEPALENPYLLALARIAVARGHAAVAEHWLGQTHRASYAASLPTETDGVRKQVLLAAAQLSDGRNAEAMASAKSALETVQSSPVRAFLPRLEAESAWTLAVAERRNGLLEDARSHLERTLELLRANDDAQSLSIARAQLTLAACLSDLGDRQSARMLLGQADRAVASHHELSAEALRALRTLSR
jgi:serine/threonine protein kinase/predicted negative regulator of RcsB-dependent stress response